MVSRKNCMGIFFVPNVAIPTIKKTVTLNNPYKFDPIVLKHSVYHNII
ncbi:unnamed protein product [Acanthoscelides obtectus]|uniref:Uncharacterized protein n=1 Tax=Acanthoscelides obtectus TaxID=200917 RepID=A0A9P0PP53_ACAOB|nr:unnamed protein product [Acanthoscelides obtectus]CAK1653620.1 hypothetical protein AOBTE_LOCUS18306 [Acanthoscelides obtectus]